MQYFPQPIIWPSFAATEIPTTFADAPMGVALPPISVPIESVQARTERSTPWVADKLLITGIIVAANGILSTKALAMADIHITIAIIRIALLPLTFAIKPATDE